MPIDTFTLSEFESALPVHKVTGAPMAVSIGIIKGEHCFLIPLANHSALMIRSSISKAGISARTGEDSIRVTVVSPREPYHVLLKKNRNYVTRVTGWRDRLVILLREEAKRALGLRKCGVCGEAMGLFTCKHGSEAGRMFWRCVHCERFAGWVQSTEPEVRI